VDQVVAQVLQGQPPLELQIKVLLEVMTLVSQAISVRAAAAVQVL
jgi:hypothetical protein